MNWEIFTYGGGEFLRLIFNAIATITAGNDYITLLGSVALIGLLWVMVEGAFGRKPLNFQWILIVVLIYNGFMVPKVNVIITDRIDSTQSGVVQNVPLGLAMFAGSSSLIGDWMARTFDTTFSLPGPVSYTQSGMLFAHHLVEASTHFEITDTRTQANLSEFWQNCVFYDILLNRYTWSQIFNSSDTWAFLQSNVSQARSFRYTDSSNNQAIIGCRAAIASGGPLNADITNAITAAESYYGQKLIKDPNPANAAARFAAAMPASFNYLTGMSLSNAQIIRQNALANSMRRGLTQFSGKVGADAAAQDFAIARAEQERRTTYAVLGQLAGRMLPILRNLFEAFIYAIFPIVFVLMMLPTAGAVVLAYLKAVLWIQLWAPLYAILHFAMTFFSRYPAGTALLDDAGGRSLSLATHTGLGQVMSDTSLIAGYLSLSIPMISYLVINRGGAMMASLASRMGQSYEAPVSKGADEATTGNISLGNSAFNNVRWFQHDTSPSYRAGVAETQDPVTGTITRTAAGHESRDVMQSNLPFNVDLASRMSSAYDQRLTESRESAINAALNYSTMVGSSLNDMQRLSTQISSNAGTNDAWNTAEAARFQENLAEVNRISQEYGNSRGYSTNQSAQMLGTASLAAQNPKLLDLVNPVSLRGALEIRGKSDAQIMEDFKDAYKVAQDTNFGSVWQSTVDAGRSAGASIQMSTGSTLAGDVSAGLTEFKKQEESVTATLRESVAWQSAQSRVDEASASITIPGEKAVYDYMIGSEKGIFARPGDTEPRWTPTDVDRIAAGVANGDPYAIQVVNHYADDYVQNRLADIVGVQGAPDRSAVDTAYQGYTSSVPGPDSVRSEATANRAAVRQRGEENEGLSEGRVWSRFGSIQQNTLTRYGDTTGEIADRSSAAESRTAEQETNVRDWVDPDKRTLTADAMDGAGRVLPGANSFSDLKDKASEAIFGGKGARDRNRND